MNTPKRHPLAVTGLLALVVGVPALAQNPANSAPPKAVFAEIGLASGATRSASAGISWPWPGRWQPANPALTGHWDAYLSHWSAHSATTAGHRESLTQIALVPVLRWRFDGGRSNWFTEGGIGLSLLDQRYQTPNKRFSTHFNFADHLGLGMNWGPNRQYELALRLVHISNADIKKPNPGENFLQLRYSQTY